MTIRLLRGEATPCEAEYQGCKITFEAKVISSAQQARLMDLASRAITLAGTHAYAAEVLRTAVQGLVIGGQEVDPVELAERADLSDPDTLGTIAAIVGAADKVLFAGGDEVKKSDLPPAP